MSIHVFTNKKIENKHKQNFPSECKFNIISGLKNQVNNIMKTKDRLNLWLAQTPQMFSYDILTQSIMGALKNNVVITDESSAVEYAGFNPILVKGRRSNIKITIPADIELANFYLAHYKNSTVIKMTKF